MRSLPFVLIFTACSPKPALSPMSARGERDGVSLTADTAVWRGSPSALNDFAVAVAVSITNGGTQAISVSSDDFVMFEGVMEHERLDNGELVHVRRLLSRLSPRGAHEALAITTREPPPLVGRDAMTLSQAAMTERSSEMTEREAWKQSDRFLVYRGPLIYFSGPVTYTGTPDAFYLVAQPTPPNDLAAQALAEGPLASGESRRGFLYFTRPDAHATGFTVEWRARPLDRSQGDEAESGAITLTFRRG